MDKVAVVTDFEDSYPGCPIEMRPPDNPTEIVCTASADAQCTLQIAVIELSQPRCHARTFTIFSLAEEGEIVLHMNDQSKTLTQGSVGVVYPGEVYWAESTKPWPATAIIVSVLPSAKPARSVYSNRFCEGVLLLRRHLQALSDEISSLVGACTLREDDLQAGDQIAAILTMVLSQLAEDPAKAFRPIDDVFVPNSHATADVEFACAASLHELRSRFALVEASLERVERVGLISDLRGPGQALCRAAEDFDQAFAIMKNVINLLWGLERSFEALGIKLQIETPVGNV